MPKYGRFQFADNAEIKRRAGSDWMFDKQSKWRKLRSWDSAESKWTPTKAGEDYYKKIGGVMDERSLTYLPCTPFGISRDPGGRTDE